jgi:hypothetical protein
MTLVAILTLFPLALAIGRRLGQVHLLQLTGVRGRQPIDFAEGRWDFDVSVVPQTGGFVLLFNAKAV